MYRVLTIWCTRWIRGSSCWVRSRWWHPCYSCIWWRTSRICWRRISSSICRWTIVRRWVCWICGRVCWICGRVGLCKRWVWLCRGWVWLCRGWVRLTRIGWFIDWLHWSIIRRYSCCSSTYKKFIVNYF